MLQPISFIFEASDQFSAYEVLKYCSHYSRRSLSRILTISKFQRLEKIIWFLELYFIRYLELLYESLQNIRTKNIEFHKFWIQNDLIRFILVLSFFQLNGQNKISYQNFIYLHIMRAFTLELNCSRWTNETRRTNYSIIFSYCVVLLYLKWINFRAD